MENTVGAQQVHVLSMQQVQNGLRVEVETSVEQMMVSVGAGQARIGGSIVGWSMGSCVEDTAGAEHVKDGTVGAASVEQVGIGQNVGGTKQVKRDSIQTRR